MGAKNFDLKYCPQCQHPTFKPYGVCNAITCEKCKICWNWRTRKTANSKAELLADKKNLWEKDELKYQQSLNSNDLKKLIENAGGEYHADYIRGSQDENGRKFRTQKTCFTDGCTNLTAPVPGDYAGGPAFYEWCCRPCHQGN